ncbi:MAG TPA: hypothetical protein VFA18_14960 [Gemmataceae bacterium]|nr:hypothetical protein [Gemmataceae bacterium]
MKRRAIYAAGIIVIVLVVLLAPYAWRRIDQWAGVIHQRAVTKELAGWESEYGQVRNWEQAQRAIGMLEYVQHYYVPGPGYRSDEKTEAELEAQRARTVQAIVAALKKFTGQDFGADAKQWQDWMRKAHSGTSQGRDVLGGKR